MRHRSLGLCMALVLCGLGSPALAQTVDVAPDTCAEAQAVDLDPAEQFELEFIDADDDQLRTDRDYFRYRAEPGKRLTIEHNFFSFEVERRTLLQILDEQCNVLLSNVGNRGFDFFDFRVPASGEFVVGVADPEDVDFSGDGNGSRFPDYIYRITEQGPVIDSVAVRVTDAATGNPLPGTEGPFARVRVGLCTAQSFCPAVGRGAADALGAFRVATDRSGRAIRAGRIQVTAAAQGYPAVTVELEVAEGEAPRVDIALTRSQPDPE